MLTATAYITTMFSKIVADVATRYGSNVHYEHGHPLEIIDTLKSMSKNQAISELKYPLIALFQDYDEEQGIKVGIVSDVKFHLIIAVFTQKEWNAEQRMTNSFIPVLYPVYSHLMKSICQSGYFNEGTEDKIKRTKTDRMYWGKSGLYGSDGNLFDDRIDVIEIANMQLSVKKLVCNI